MVVYLYNRLSGKVIFSTIFYELFYGKKLSILYIRVFGLTVYIYLQRYQFKYFKFSDRVKFFVFIGFTDGIKVYKLLDFYIYQITYLRSVIFDEIFISRFFSGIFDSAEFGGDFMYLDLFQVSEFLYDTVLFNLVSESELE